MWAHKGCAVAPGAMGATPWAAARSVDVDGGAPIRSGANRIRSGTLAAMNARRCGPFFGPCSNVATKLTPPSLLMFAPGS
jgi:hypothetical protein